jgi:hypothetical protein
METKICPYCRQDIPADSVKCHHCREWVNWRTPGKRILLGTVVFLVFMAGLMLSAEWVTTGFMSDFTSDAMFDEQKLWEQPDALQITDHHAGRDEEGGRCVIGTMKNVSTIPWRFITVQVDYYNSQGELVDTSLTDSRRALPPGHERSFKVVFGPDQSDVEYDHYRVLITGADDASRF